MVGSNLVYIRYFRQVKVQLGWVVQMSAAFQRTWRGDWICAAGSRQIRNAVHGLIRLNYFILGVSPSPTI